MSETYTFDARHETTTNLFRLIAADETTLHVCARVAQRPKPGDRVIALTGEMFPVTKVWQGTQAGRSSKNAPGTKQWHIILTKEHN